MNIQKLSNSAEIKMPAGTYKGRSIEDVPNSYLEWLVDELDDKKSPKLISEIEKELTFRKKFNINVTG